MSDTDTRPGRHLGDRTGSDDPDTRGTLELAPKVVTKIAEQSALAVGHVVRSPGSGGSGALGGLVGRTLPRASATVDRDRVRLDLDVAVGWPCPLEEVAAEIRHHVATETARLTGLDVRSTDVTLHAVPDAGRAKNDTGRVR